VVVPLILKDSAKNERGYYLAEEVKDKLDIKDSGSISKANVTNKSDKPVFMRGGSILKGAGTQSRAVQFGRIVLPEKAPVPVAVVCVHASHPISTNAAFELIESGKAYALGRSLDRTLMLYRGDQHAAWNTVRYTASKASSEGVPLRATDSMVHIAEQVSNFKKDVEDIVRKVPNVELQIGVLIMDEKGVQGMEAFDHPDSWGAFADDVFRKYSDVIQKEDASGILDINMDKVLSLAKGFINELQNVKREEIYSDGDSATFAIDGEKVVGEVTTLNNRIIHIVVATRKEEEKRREREPRTERPPRLPRDYYDYRYPFYLRNEIYPYVTYGEKYLTDPDTRTYRLKSKPVQYLKSKGAVELLSSVEGSPKRWVEIESKLKLSTRTLSYRAKEAKMLGLISSEVRTNGKQAYTLTDEGKKALRKFREIADTLK
jgi:hypothetical protein